MAKEKKVEEVKEEPKVIHEEEKPLVQSELEFICRMCLKLQGKPGSRSSDCIMKNSVGLLCSSMQKLSDKLTRLETVNDRHDKYLKAFNVQVYYTKEEIHELYLKVILSKETSEEEFSDYLRNAGFIIV